MKKNKKELMRIQSLIENDRLNFGEKFEELIIHDLNNILKDYFDFNGNTIINIAKINDRYKIDISILANRIKSFGIVPKNQ